MKNTIRILCAVLAMAMLMTGCTMPKIVLPGTPDVAVTTSNGQSMSTGEYLAHLYLNFEQMYSSILSYQQSGKDPWTDKDAQLPYENENGETVNLDLETYLIRASQDIIKQRLAIEKIIADNNLTVNADDAKLVDEELATLGEGAYLPAGISNENFIKTYKSLSLDWDTAFFGLYGAGGPKAVAETEIRNYFDTNYLSYKIIEVSLTKSEKDAEGKTQTVPLSADEKAAELKKLNEYLTINNTQGFEAAMDASKKAAAQEGTTVEPSTDEQNRINNDATTMDAKLVAAIRSVDVGSAKIVEYGGDDAANPTTAALIVRLDINSPAELYTDSVKAILNTLKGEEFNKQVEELVAATTYTFNAKVEKKCSPKNFAE